MKQSASIGKIANLRCYAMTKIERGQVLAYAIDPLHIGYVFPANLGIPNQYPAGVARRDIEKGEVVELNSMENTKDVILKIDSLMYVPE